MSFLALVLAAQLAQRADTVPPYLSFPEPGLDDPAAYQGYATRLFRDAASNAIQVYMNARTGRVVLLWADAADESVGFTARDSASRPAALAWGSGEAVVAASGRTRSVVHTLEAPSPVTIGLFLLGSMRVERDFQYAGRDSLPLDAQAFPQPELLDLIAHVERLDDAERARALALLHAPSVAALRARLDPRITAPAEGGVVQVEQESFDGRSHLSVVLQADTSEAVLARSGPTVTVRSRSRTRARFTVRVTTDSPTLTALSREEIFNDDFRRFLAAAHADTAHPERFRRLDREVRGMELLCYREKLMAGLPTFATYFGRDMLMTALLMTPVWAPAMPEHVIASALRKLSPTGDVSHEEALGGQAIRENAAEYNRLITSGQLARARGVLAHLAATRENYIMVDDDLQLPIVAARYLADPRVAGERKRRFLLTDRRLQRLAANLSYVARQTAPYVQAPTAVNLVSFPRDADGRWISASWRDSRAGYAGGRFAMDVNVIWAPRAVAAIGTILDALHRLGFPQPALDSLAPAFRDAPLAAYVRNQAALERAVATWMGTERHFRVALSPSQVGERVAARLSWLPRPESAYWRGGAGGGGGGGAAVPTDTFRFLALALDSIGRPIPIVNTDPAMLLLLDTLGPGHARELVEPIMLPYPVGLFVEGLGPLVANDSYATPDVWDSFRRDPYHSPTVVWGRDVNALLAGLALQILAAPGSGTNRSALQAALHRTVEAVDRSGLRHAELWSYQIENGRLLPVRYGTSSDVQLWSLTDLAVQYLQAQLPPP